MQRGKDISARFKGLFVVHHNMPGSTVSSHSHPEHHIIIPLQGEVTVDTSGRKLICGPGRMIYIAPKAEHIFQSAAQKGERLICMIDQSAWKKAEAGVHQTGLLPASQLCKELLFHLLLNQQSKNGPALIDALVRTVSELLDGGARGPLSMDHLEASVSREDLRKALAVARELFKSSLSVSDLAKKSGFSVRNLSRLFHVELGISPKQLLMMLRIEKAGELLSSGMTVTETAFAVGYSSLSQFIQAFRQITGKLPSEFH